MLNRRLQVLVDEDRYERLSEESRRSGAPVGELVRRAIDREYPAAGPDAERERAGRELLSMAAPSGSGPEPDWDDQKKTLVDSPADRWPGA